LALIVGAPRFNPWSRPRHTKDDKKRV